jgi:RNA polymerase sigma-70 factor (ECF subfamily)
MANSTVEFEKLVENYSKRVLGIAIRVLGDADKAQDVHQDVFLSIWKRWHKFNGKVANWDGYLYRATVRKAVELAKRKPHGSFDNQDPQSFSHDITPEMDLKAAELRKKLSKIIALLPERQADVFIMSRIEGLSYDEIAEILGCTAQTARVHLHRALRNLAGRLVEYFPKQQVG